MTHEIPATAPKKGRKPISPTGISMTAAERQRRARSIALDTLCNGNIKDISTSGLIALLPGLISDKSKRLLKAVCQELIAREG